MEVRYIMPVIIKLMIAKKPKIAKSHFKRPANIAAIVLLESPVPVGRVMPPLEDVLPAVVVVEVLFLQQFGAESEQSYNPTYS